MFARRSAPSRPVALNWRNHGNVAVARHVFGFCCDDYRTQKNPEAYQASLGIRQKYRYRRYYSDHLHYQHIDFRRRSLSLSATANVTEENSRGRICQVLRAGKVVLRDNGTLNPDHAAVCDCVQRATNFSIAANMHDSLMSALNETIGESSRLLEQQPEQCSTATREILEHPKAVHVLPIEK